MHLHGCRAGQAIGCPGARYPSNAMAPFKVPTRREQTADGTRSADLFCPALAGTQSRDFLAWEVSTRLKVAVRRRV